MPTLGTLKEISDYITPIWIYTKANKFWDLSETGFKGVIKYNVTGHTGDSDGMAPIAADRIREALKYLENVTGIDFEETTTIKDRFTDAGNGVIYFQNNDVLNQYGQTQNGAWGGSTPDTDGHYQRGVVNGRFDGGDSTSDYYIRYILHEVGHVLGLGHPGDYRGSTNYPTAATFTNDSYQNSVMSYFDQDENTSITASKLNPTTMMSVDFLALDKLYGSQTYNGRSFGTSQAFTGDTVYGFNTNISASTDPYLSKLSANAATRAFTIADGSGADTFDFSGWSNNQTIDLRPSDANATSPSISDIAGKVGNLTLAVGTIIENARGGSGNDTIRGNQADNSLSGNNGNDTLYGDSGNDRLFGGSGNDSLYGGNGDDTLNGGPGVDTLNGDSGNDVVSYYSERSSIVVNLSAGTNNQGDRYTSIEGVEGSNYANDTLTGNNGANTLRGWGGDDTLTGYGGRDKLIGDAGNDVLRGGYGLDTLEGGTGNDKLYGEGGNDYFYDISGVDYFDGGSGNDTVSYGGVTSSVVVDLLRNYNNQSDKYVSIESLVGSNTANDTLTGNNGANTLLGRGGNDSLIGNDGDDRLFGDAGNDTLYGNSGNDRLYGGPGDDYLRDESGSDQFHGGSGSDMVSYYGWYVSGKTLTINLKTGANNDNDKYYSIENVLGSKRAPNDITGDDGVNRLKGGDNNDTLYGLAGNDNLNGGAGADTIEGGAGRDFMYAGNDTNRDIFVFRSISDSGLTTSTRDRINQFDSGEDDIDLHVIDANTSMSGDQAFSFSTSGAKANAIWVTDTGVNLMVSGDVSGDAKADFSILVTSINALQVSDFIL